MSGRSDERSVETLRRRAERAMDEGRGRVVVEPLLERILKVAPEGDPGRIFAHRHLAELRLEEDPWAAALHLRKVIGAKPHDDVSHSLMALAQALLGNYRTAVAAYRRALSLEPRNPWYHHNLGHLLDVALDEPHIALSHLEVALAHADPPEHEITASVAHCLARVGRVEQARELAQEAVRAAPKNGEHRALLSWIDRGAPAGKSAHGLKRDSRRPSSAEPASGKPGSHPRRNPAGERGDARALRVTGGAKKPAENLRATRAGGGTSERGARAEGAKPPADKVGAKRATGGRASPADPASERGNVRDLRAKRASGGAKHAAEELRAKRASPASAKSEPRGNAPARSNAARRASQRGGEARRVKAARDARARGHEGGAGGAIEAPREELDLVVGSDVEQLLVDQMRAAGLSARQVARALSLWADYRGEREPRVKRPEVCAAAVHYAIVVVDSVDGISQTAIARHYGVPAKSVSSRFGDIQRALSLRRGDPRYAR